MTNPLSYHGYAVRDHLVQCDHRPCPYHFWRGILLVSGSMRYRSKQDALLCDSIVFQFSMSRASETRCRRVQDLSAMDFSKWVFQGLGNLNTLKH